MPLSLRCRNGGISQPKTAFGPRGTWVNCDACRKNSPPNKIPVLRKRHVLKPIIINFTRTRWHKSGYRPECKACAKPWVRKRDFAPDPSIIHKECLHCKTGRDISEFGRNRIVRTITEKMCNQCYKVKQTIEFALSGSSLDGYACRKN